MKNQLLLMLVAFLSAGKPAEVFAQVAGRRDGLIVVGRIDTLHSSILKEERAIWISEPESGIIPGKTYPVVYLLDGDEHFYSVMGMIRQMSAINGNAMCPEVIIVGIPNTDRTRDLTPIHVEEAMGDSLFMETTGGLGRFTSFLEKELMPFMESHYPVSPYKSYIGHSLGGLAVIHTLLTHPELFNAWVAIDPSLSWDDRLIEKMSDALNNKKKFAHETLYLAIANTMPAGMSLDQVVKDLTSATDHIRAILEFRDDVEKKTTSNGMDFKARYYPEEDPMSLPLVAEIDAFKYLYAWYTFGYKDLRIFIDQDTKHTAKELVDLLNDHFETVSDHVGYNVPPDERMINSLGYEFLALQKNELSFACFDLNVKNFSHSANVFDSMGDYYVTIGEVEKGVDFYAKALAVEEVPLTREK